MRDMNINEIKEEEENYHNTTQNHLYMYTYRP